MHPLLTTIEHMAVAVGATHARVVGTAELLPYDHVIASCAANACGRYNRCWTCPPQTGTLEEMTQTFHAFPDGGVIIQNISTLEDSWDFEGMEAAAHQHNQMIRDITRRIREQFATAELLPFGCGGCGFCEKCTCPDAPCRFPAEALTSVEGNGLDVKALLESVGLHYINGVNTVSYVGLILAR